MFGSNELIWVLGVNSQIVTVLLTQIGGTGIDSIVWTDKCIRIAFLVVWQGLKPNNPHYVCYRYTDIVAVTKSEALCCQTKNLFNLFCKK